MSDNLSSPLSKVRALGSAKSGTHHWLAQRVTAIFIMPLAIWFVASFSQTAASGDVTTIKMWFASPIIFALSSILFSLVFYHSALGLQVVVEDYITNKALKVIALVKIKFFMLIAWIITITSFIQLHFF